MQYLLIFIVTVVSSFIGAILALLAYNWVPLMKEAMALYRLQKKMEKEGKTAWDSAPVYTEEEPRKVVGPQKVEIGPGSNYIPRRMP